MASMYRYDRPHPASHPTGLGGEPTPSESWMVDIQRAAGSDIQSGLSLRSHLAGASPLDGKSAVRDPSRSYFTLRGMPAFGLDRQQVFVRFANSVVKTRPGLLIAYPEHQGNFGPGVRE